MTTPQTFNVQVPFAGLRPPTAPVYVGPQGPPGPPGSGDSGDSSPPIYAVSETIDVSAGQENNTKYRTTYSYNTGSLSVFRNGLREIPRECYAEDESNDFDFWLSAPAAPDDVVIAAYTTPDTVDFGAPQLVEGHQINLDGAQLRDQSVTADKLHPSALSGARGAIWFFGDGPPPEPYVGAQPDDLYLDRTTGTVYHLGG